MSLVVNDLALPLGNNGLRLLHMYTMLHAKPFINPAKLGAADSPLVLDVAL